MDQFEMEKSSKLDTGTQKNNVFVTQLQDKNEDEDVRALVTDPESTINLTDNDKKTLQHTLSSRKENTVAYTKQELNEKRREFEARMKGLSQRRSALKEKRQQMKDRVARFERFIRENNVKRERALTNYQNDTEVKQKKSEECNLLHAKIMELKKRYGHLTNKIARYAIYKKFLNRIIETLPEDYICVSDDKVHSLLLRYQTLNATNDKLMKRLNDAGNQLEQLREAQEAMQGIHEKETFEANNEMAGLVKELETHTDLNEKREQLLMCSKSNHMERRLELSVILLAIDTIVEKCHEDSWQQKQDLTVDEKLKCIKEWLLNQSGLVKLVQTEMAQTSPHERHHMNPAAYKAK